MKPDKEIDGAKVLEWAWSGDRPFGVIHYADSDVAPIEIYGLALCQYPDSDKIYRFSCNKNWETEQDMKYLSIEEAKSRLPDQYKQVSVNWIKFE